MRPVSRANVVIRAGAELPGGRQEAVLRANVDATSVAPEDQWQLRITPASRRLTKFFELWTRAEALLKARGAGLSGLLDFADAERFATASFEPASGYAAALAIEGDDLEISCWRWMK